MSRKTILMAAPLGLGGLVLLWAALAARSEPEAKRPLAAPKPVSVRKGAPAEPPSASGISVAAPFVAASPAPSSSGGENARIEERIRKMEEQLLTLETKRNSLGDANQALERQIAEKSAETSARMMADWRVRALEPLLGLSETQKQSLLELWTKWYREDSGRTAGRETWLSREQDFRARLGTEQAAKLHDTTVQQTQALWTHLGRTIGAMIGAPKEEQSRLQQALGDYRPATTMLLPEGYGADWGGLMQEGASRLQPILSQDQMTKLSRFFPPRQENR
jgi:hypothetical protein